MALGEGGLDAQVEQRMDAYRGNPQQLQKRYGANKQLLDLLALQKLKTEKDETAKAMQAAQQQNPNTIAQQREQEALALVKAEMGGTLGELTGRTAATLNQKAATQKKNMNRLAKNAAKPPAGIAGLMGARPPQGRPPMGNPQAQGLANARMAQAAAQPGGPQRMAQGGIVGFKTGDLIKLSDADKEKAGRAFGPLAESMIADIETMKEGSQAANLLLERIAQETRTPVGEFFSSIGKTVSSALTGRLAENELMKKIDAEFGQYANPIIGPFSQQTPEAQKYAKEVMNRLPFMTEPELLAFSEIDFDPLARATTIAKYPVVEKTVEDVDVSASTTAEVNPLATTDDLKKGTIAYPPVYRNPQDILSEVSPSYDPQGVVMPSTDAMTATQALLAEAGEATPSASLLEVNAPKIAPLVPTDGTGLTQEGENIKAALLERDRLNANIDPIQKQKDAQIASDAYLQRQRNRDDYLASAEAERELQSRTMSPAQLASEARIATFSGGRKGRGGMSQAYLQAMKNQRADLSGGLSNLRNIQQNRIATDLDTGQTGSARGGEAAIGARDAVARGESGLRSELDAQRKSALQEQELKTGLNVAVYKHDSAVAANTFEEAGKVIARNFSRLTSQLDNDETRYNAQVKQAIADTGAVNNALAARVEQVLENAKARAELAFKSGELAQTGVNEAKELLRKYELEATKLMNDKLAKDLGFMELNSLLSQMSEAENPDEFAQLQARVEGIYQSHLAQQILIAPDIFGEQEALKDYIARLEAGAPSSQSIIGRGSVTGFSEDLDKSGAPGYR